MLHALVAVKLDDLFYRTLFQMHPVEVFPDENIDPTRAGAVFPEAFTPRGKLVALLCFLLPALLMLPRLKKAIVNEEMWRHLVS